VLLSPQNKESFDQVFLLYELGGVEVVFPTGLFIMMNFIEVAEG
jgi:hypothetical protein